jgi:hypothetical protein
LEVRKGVLKIHEVYEGYEPIGIRETTDYTQAEAAFCQKFPYCIKPADREAWPVGYRNGASEIITKLATEQAEAQIQAFISRARAKLDPVAKRAGEYRVRKMGDGGLQGSVWVGELQFSFLGGEKGVGKGLTFTARFKVITNFSKHGKPYGQYPITFHDLVHTADAPIMTSASIEDLWRMVNYKAAPAAQEPIQRWKKLVAGSVVLIDGQPTLIESPSRAKALGIADDTPQIARIESVIVDGHNRTNFPSARGRIDHADGRRERITLERDFAATAFALEDAGKYNQAVAEGRRLIFAAAFGKK